MTKKCSCLACDPTSGEIGLDCTIANAENKPYTDVQMLSFAAINHFKLHHTPYGVGYSFDHNSYVKVIEDFLRNKTLDELTAESEKLGLYEIYETNEQRLAKLAQGREDFDTEITLVPGDEDNHDMWHCDVSLWNKCMWQYRGVGRTIDEAISDVLKRIETCAKV